ncbi:MAG: L,D-transpeptidase family protein [Candidatus Omnitrophota bacterium]
MNRNILLGIIAAAAVVGGIMIFSSGGGDQQPAAFEDNVQKEAQDLYRQAQKLKRKNEPLAAKQAYREILQNYPEAVNAREVQKELYDLNMELLLSNRPVEGKTVIHEVEPGDTLGKISKTYGVTIPLIKKSNNLKSDVIRVGQKLRIWQGDFNIYVDKSQNILILKDKNDVLKVYDVSTGENNSTPVGTFKITTKLVDPVWFNRGIVVPPESPQNVLGTRWLGFDVSAEGYGIHGTIEPETIGQQVTAGCVRMLNEDVEEVYDLVPSGTEVTIVD